MFPIFPEMVNLLSSKERLEQVAQDILEFVRPWDLCIFFFFGWCCRPILVNGYQYAAISSPSSTICVKKIGKGDFQIWNNLIDLFSQAVRISAMVYVIELVLVITTSLELIHLVKEDIQNIVVTFVGRVLYTVWITFHLKAWKEIILSKLFKRGLASLLDHVANFIIYCVMIIFIVHYVGELQKYVYGQCDNDDTLASLFAFGSLGTLVLSLMNQNLFSQIVSGLLLSASDKFHVGDWIRIGDKGSISGTVVKVGWIETEIQGACVNA